MLCNEGKKEEKCLLAGVWKPRGIENSMEVDVVFRQRGCQTFAAELPRNNKT
jgi:hypothetical protein